MLFCQRKKKRKVKKKKKKRIIQTFVYNIVEEVPIIPTVTLICKFNCNRIDNNDSIFQSIYIVDTIITLFIKNGA